MANQNNNTSNSSYYYIPALLCGILTVWVVTGSIGYMILGAVFGLLSAAFWINVVQKNEEA